MDEKKLSGRRMFFRRLDRTNERKEFNALAKQIQEERRAKGESDYWYACSWEAMYRMGYVNLETEREIYRNSLLADKVDSLERDQVTARCEAALAELPLTASRTAELDWISTHPAMSRQDRAVDDARVLVTANDVLRALNGPAPSQRAVRQLQHWVNEPRAFQKAMLGPRKPKTPAEKAPKKTVVEVEDEGEATSPEDLVKELAG